jgi:hypothetical protein
MHDCIIIIIIIINLKKHLKMLQNYIIWRKIVTNQNYIHMDVKLILD